MRKKKILLILGDVLCLYLALYIALLLRNHTLTHYIAWPFAIVFLIWLVVFYIGGFNDFEIICNKLKFYSLFWKLFLINTVIAVFLFYLNIGIFSISPKRILFFQVIVFAMLSLAWRNLFRNFIQHFPENILIIGHTQKAKDLAKIIDNLSNFNLVALLKNSNCYNLNQLFKQKKIDSIVVANNPYLKPKIARDLFQYLPLKFYDLPSFYERVCKKVPISALSKVWFLQNIEKKRDYEIGKRCFDLLSASIILAITIPFWPLIGFLIKWDSPGPIFYKQTRTGKNNQEFKVWKFRTMVKNAEKKGGKWTKEKDPRITKVGGFLRKTRLDELPQIINILKGDMSLIGPRAERIEFVKKRNKELPYYSIRHIIKPGITGWAQIKFPHGVMPEHAKEKLRYDLYYIKNRSLVFDFFILLRTIKIVLGMEGN